MRRWLKNTLVSGVVALLQHVDSSIAELVVVFLFVV